ncbi:carbon-nitrogen hydrolase family protein [Larkinella terrae]|uniref:Carbon-nitrogen hydrolase family protein n=1 Tax=Larkinella terrae TaxID=2025311 RepID=A0A7K0EMG6_9BACT|nr:carbon-nitrogen hydrolase family protein [Larkinella terrae]MRS63004.1 carbon-nitrogen hydrolase family protein [Larkinella terrae]
MKLCVAQTRPVKGDIPQNIENHKAFIDRAVSLGVDTIIFPELSLTGYEPELAGELATTPDDDRFDEFQEISDANQLTIVVGMPTRSPSGNLITLIIFQPNLARQTYSKHYLHADEEPFFVSGDRPYGFIGTDVALAICYELSVPAHSETAFKHGAKVYLVSVAKTAIGVENAVKSLSEIAQKYAMTVLMANSVGPSDNFISGGKSSIWNTAGELVGQLNESDEGILLIDTESQEVKQETL